MATIRYKGVVIGNGVVNEGVPISPVPNQITILGSPFFEGPPGGGSSNGADIFYSNVANVISNLAINGVASIYITTLAADKTAIEGAVTIIPASTVD